MKFKHILNLLLFLSFGYGSSWVHHVDASEQRSIAPAVIDSNVEETILSFEFTGFYQREVDTSNGIQYIIDLEGGASILEKGAPDIDKYSTSIIIPDDALTSVEIISSSYHDFYDISIIPSKGNLSRDIDPASVPYEYGSDYKSNAFYPGVVAELSDPYIIRELRGQSIALYPLQYNASTKTLRLYTSIELKIKSSPGESINVLDRSLIGERVSKEFDDIYQDVFLNYENDTRFNYLLDQGNMLIISYGDFIDEMMPFVDWKNKKGIPTEIVNVTLVGSNSNSIKTFVSDYYYEHGLTYLLLVGDVAQIPTPIINGASSDPSYGFISGNDSFSEIFVGRFSANNPSQLTTQITRTLEYEQSPSYVEHFDKAFGVASNQGPGYGGYTDDEFNDFLWDTLLSGYTYSNFQSVHDPSGSVSQGVNIINSGVGIINYTGHAGPTGWGNGAPLGVNDVNNLQNADMLPFIFTVGCNPGEFNNYDECFGESWLRSSDSNGNPTGAIAFLGSTISQSWEPPMHGQWAMNSILTESYDENKSRSFGSVSVNGCMHMNEAQGSSGINETNHWTIFGDPSVLLRTDHPVALNPIHDSAILIGQTEFVVDVGVDEGLVALSNDDGLIASSYVQDGVAVLSLDGMDMIPGTLSLVITSFNAYAYETEVNVISPDGAYVLATGYSFVSDSGLDNQVSFGDYVEVNILAENVGSENASAISVSVTTLDEYISIVNGNSLIAYAIVNEETSTESPVTFNVAGNVPDGHMASFNVLFDNGEGDTWSGNFSIEIHATDFQVLNAVFIDEDQNGVFDPGESAALTVDLANLGSADFGWYPGAQITSNSEYIQLESDSLVWLYGISSEDSYEWTFYLSADSDTPLGTTGTVSIFWGASDLSSGWCNELAGGCPEPFEFIYTMSIGLPFDDQLATPENLDASVYSNYIELAWDEPILFDCDADAPYSDDCYAYVIEIDPYCCDFNWDSICEGAYQDCIGRDINKEEFQVLDSDRQIQDFNSSIYELVRDREITGYNIFRNGDYIASSVFTIYNDSDISNSTEYCYYVTAMYDNGQSYGSEEVCVETMGIQGDANGDNEVNVLDVIIVVNMIFGLEDENLLAVDLNQDGEVSILDIIILVNMIIS